ncbi:hypothetical protein Kisp02_08050 [Kineosporia sp. NBRC 101731]|nr:hypothetical protein Kisp02_08050 [Kineosporia sp. NBRC 101731]
MTYLDPDGNKPDPVHYHRPGRNYLPLGILRGRPTRPGEAAA